MKSSSSFQEILALGAKISLSFRRPAACESSWTIATERRRVDNINDPLAELLDILWSHRLPLMDYLSKQQVSAIFSISVTIHQERPVYCFPPATLRRLGEIGVELCLDVYDYSK